MKAYQFIFIPLLITIAFAKDCRKDETQPWGTENFYECKSSEKCCFDNGLPSCCAEKDTYTKVMEQVQLWGGVIGVLVFIGIVVACYRRENSCCSEDSTCCCCYGCKKKKEKDEVKILAESFSDEFQKKPLV